MTEVTHSSYQGEIGVANKMDSERAVFGSQGIL